MRQNVKSDVGSRLLNLLVEEMDQAYDVFLSVLQFYDNGNQLTFDEQKDILTQRHAMRMAQEQQNQAPSPTTNPNTWTRKCRKWYVVCPSQGILQGIFALLFPLHVRTAYGSQNVRGASTLGHHAGPDRTSMINLNADSNQRGKLL